MSSRPKQKGNTKSDKSSVSTRTDQKLLQGIVSLLSLSAVFILSLSRIFLAANPMTRDEGTYGYLGKLAIKGFTPYVDFYEMKPPMLFYLYGLGGSLFGFTDLGLRLFALLLNLCSSLLIFLILRQYISKHYALVASALFAILSLNPYAFGFAMVAEHIVNTFVLLSLFLLHKNYTQKGLLFVVLAGAAFSIAILTKQTAILFSPVFLLCFIIARNKKPWFLQCLRFAGGVIIPVFLMIIILWIQGAFDDALYWLTTYPAKYSATFSKEDGKIYLEYFSKNISLFQISLMATSLLALLVNAFRARQTPHSWLLVYFLMAAICIMPGLRFYGQYWLPLFVPMALLTGAALHLLDQKKTRIGLVFAFLVLSCIAGELVIHRDYYFNEKSSEEINKLYFKNPFGAIRKLSMYAGELMKDDETIMMLGSEPQVYLYANRLAPTKHVFMRMITKNDEKSTTYTTEILGDLENKKPAYVLVNSFSFSWGMTDKSNDELYQKSFSYVYYHYTPIAAYNMNSTSYLYADKGDSIDVNTGNQVILFKIK